EQNAIIQAAGSGARMDGATMYCTDSPCSTCTKMIINAGISRLVLGAKYPDELGERMIAEAGIETVYMPPGEQEKIPLIESKGG
nr:cytidine deaminase [Candidatus Krumholzibacteriota bacterium]